MQFEENQVNKSVETLKTEKMYRKLDKNKKMTVHLHYECLRI